MMDLYGSQTIETSRKPNNNPYDILKKALLHFLVLMSLVSFLLLSNNFHFSSSPLVFPLFSHSLERKYMFLICNGILAFLAKTLTFTSSFSVTNANLDYMCPPFNIQSPDTLDQLDDGEHGNKGINDNVASDENDDKTKDAQLQDDEEEKQEIFESVEEDEDESHGGALKVLEIENGGEEEEERGLLVDEEENDMNINTDELNRKIEEFIRKMKEEIRIEAKQHLIAV